MRRNGDGFFGRDWLSGFKAQHPCYSKTDIGASLGRIASILPPKKYFASVVKDCDTHRTIQLSVNKLFRIFRGSFEYYTSLSFR